MECLFCKIVSGAVPSAKVFEDDRAVAFLDINPINPGHTLVVPKEHYPDLLSTPPDLAAHLMTVVQRVASAVLNAAGAKDFNLGLNHGAGAGQSVGHVHLHIMPRRPGDGHQLFSGKPYEAGEMEEMANSIRAKLK